MTDRFSARTSWDTGESLLSAAVRAAREAGRTLIDLTVSNPTVCGFRYDEAAILGALRAGEGMRYDPDPRGMRSAREAVAGYYADHGADVDPDALVLTTSTSEGYGYLFRLLCDAGDEVLVAQPGYPLFDFLADLEDVRLRTYPLFYDYGWWIDFAELEQRIGPRTKAILVVHPNNPTGHWTARMERERLREICARHGLALIVDEVFLDYPLVESAEAVSFAAEASPVLTFVLSGMSKIAGLPQMKVGWLLTLGPDGSRREALARLEVIADTFLSMNAPVQLALPHWLDGRCGIQEQILGRVRGNLAAVEGCGMQVLQTEAGWSAVLRLGGTAEGFVNGVGVVVHPGAFYGLAGENRKVVSLLTPEVIFRAGMEQLVDATFVSS
ncbi:pyridoxal phosphate-dependent aminotransferase [Granulicella arctica]|uniref:pyridoxal phosphate-dependent aminotransferase n=1 Tax=Granulicella arctica TaxID=940613 RepID=UPI0021E0F9CC|nr:pyridoxal phosphate-dependent aminotransferase [Granulicella arctica]